MKPSEESAVPLERRIAEAFDFGAAVVDVRPLGNGLINDTFLVSTDSPAGRHAVLQRINPRAFPHPELIAENLRVLARHVAAHEHCALRVPAIYAARDGRDFVRDANGGFWRALEYIGASVTLQTVTDPRQAREAGAALGRFHALVNDLPPRRLHATRPAFHQTPVYFDRYMQAAAANGADDAQLHWCAEFIGARRAMVPILEQARQRGALTVRVIHGDPKLDNFLFDSAGERVLGLIDLDTVQPGLIHYDIGDCLRSCANPAGESPANLDQVRFDLDIGRALLTRYLDETRAFLTPPDLRHVYDAIRLIPFELGLRFLTDHLENDRYFKVQWRGHNLHRALAQFRLVADIEKKERRIRDLVAQT
jgi:Ser/Thr protein kinase RdoA (MazF antagonist)